MEGHSPALQTDLTRDQFVVFTEYIERHSGIHIDDSRLDTLRISLVTRATRFGLDSFERYFELLSADESEFQELMSLLTINETSFFRFPAQFEALRSVVVPEILEGRSAAMRTLRVWSAGCSTGEEPYSIAMTLLEAGIESLGYRVEVLGTDVSRVALERAKEGLFPPRALLNIPSEVIERYFEPTASGHQVRDRLRDVVSFRYQNLVKEPYPTAILGGWDIIFCRNVTIYFRIESTRRVLHNLFESLNPGGYLFIGHSETLTGIIDRFETVDIGGVFLHRKPSSSEPPPFSGAGEGGGRIAHQGSQQTVAAPPKGTRSDPTGHDAATARERQAAAADARPPALEDAHEQLLAARTYADDGDFAAARERAQQALCVDPLLASAYYLLGLISLRSGSSDQAIAEFKRTLYADDSFVLAHLNLGNLYRNQGEYSSACRAYEDACSAIERAPTGPWTAFLGGFEPEMLAATCARSLEECRRQTGSR
ncbi:MAG: CheR family methyltransferase [Coriobacteriia bacterium]|jgi:chemotaxis protein methyltransferase CheR|nr:CheR family methyltransferase [Coriobacteriia bacterium]